jgi:hypothetical protein
LLQKLVAIVDLFAASFATVLPFEALPILGSGPYADFSSICYSDPKFDPFPKPKPGRPIMALVALRQLLDYAAEHRFAVPAFNVSNMGVCLHKRTKTLIEAPI